MIQLKAVIPTRFLTLLVFAALVQAASQSVTVTLQDGSQVKGGFAGGGANEIKVLVAGQTLTLKTATIENIKFESAPGDSQPQGLAPTLSQSAPATPFPAVATIPANTAVFVRLIDSADSAHDEVGKVYRALLDEPIVSPTGQVIVPRAADTSLVLTKREQSGRLTGKTELTLTLRSITIQGKHYDVASSDAVEASASRTARSGKTIGGLAAAGAVIGALAGGGKGAAIGAGSGTTLGTLGQVFTSGQRVRVPSETRLTFRLEQPLLIQ